LASTGFSFLPHLDGRITLLTGLLIPETRALDLDRPDIERLSNSSVAT
jgi:hypothetical protein